MTFYRSALYVPADNARAMAKALQWCHPERVSGSQSNEMQKQVQHDGAPDIIIHDLEDGVAPEKKAKARGVIISQLCHPRESGDPAKIDSGLRRNDFLRVVRINHHSTPDYAGDIAALAACPNLDGIMLSKVASAADIDDALTLLARHDRADVPIWCNVETPLGIENAFEIAAHPAVLGLVAGTNDLANDLRLVRTPDRAGLMHSLQRLVLAARAHGKIILDGTFIDFGDEAGLRDEAKQGHVLGFDGKTLVHPKQIAIANDVFGVSQQDIAYAQRVIDAYEAAMREGKAVILLDGQMIERLHYERAKETLAANMTKN